MIMLFVERLSDWLYNNYTYNTICVALAVRMRVVHTVLWRTGLKNVGRYFAPPSICELRVCVRVYSCLITSALVQRWTISLISSLPLTPYTESAM